MSLIETRTDPLLQPYLSFTPPILPETKTALLDALWGRAADYNDETRAGTSRAERCEPYLRHYERLALEVRNAAVFYDHDDDYGCQCLTHRDVVTVVDILRRHSGIPRDQVVYKLKGTSMFCKWSDESINCVLAIAVSAWLMIDIWDTDDSIRLHQDQAIWADNECLDAFLSHQFQTCYECKPGKLIPKHLNAFDLKRMGGIKVVPTSNLLRHLVYDEELEQLSVFHLNSFLELSKHSPNLTMLPRGLVEETLNTLSILFPPGKKTASVLSKRRGTAPVFDPSLKDLMAGEPKQLSSYPYWRNRLVVILDRFEHPRQNSIRQRWYDDRNRMQWATYWFAKAILVMTLLFGLISSVTGVMQVLVATKQLHAEQMNGTG